MRAAGSAAGFHDMEKAALLEWRIFMLKCEAYSQESLELLVLRHEFEG